MNDEQIRTLLKQYSENMIELFLRELIEDDKLREEGKYRGYGWARSDKDSEMINQFRSFLSEV